MRLAYGVIAMSAWLSAEQAEDLAINLVPAIEVTNSAADHQMLGRALAALCGQLPPSRAAAISREACKLLMDRMTDETLPGERLLQAVGAAALHQSTWIMTNDKSLPSCYLPNC